MDVYPPENVNIDLIVKYLKYSILPHSAADV